MFNNPLYSDKVLNDIEIIQNIIDTDNTNDIIDILEHNRMNPNDELCTFENMCNCHDNICINARLQGIN